MQKKHSVQEHKTYAMKSKQYQAGKEKHMVVTKISDEQS